MTNLIDLAARAEQASPEEQRELLDRSYSAIEPMPKYSKNDAYRSDSDWSIWQARYGQFRRMLDASAYESAAIMLVPSDHFWSITMRGENRGGFSACCQREGGLDWRDAATPALAIVASALRARAAA